VQIKDVMTQSPVAVRFDATIQEAAAGMRDLDAGALPVVSDADQLIGIVTDRDLSVRALAEGMDPETAVANVLTRDVRVIEPSDAIEDALLLMASEQVRRLPVVEGGHLVGVVALADLAAVTAAAEFAQTVREISEPAATEAKRRTAEAVVRRPP
jgi:signal-transduction protein with cAMP-binding, CBS, and nucleotidyltransferase domain